MADILSINGVAVDMIATNSSLDTLIPHVKGGIPSLTFWRLLGSLDALPDPWSAQPVTLTMSAASPTLVFAGDVVGYLDRYDDQFGWFREYRAMGLVNRASYIPVTDEPSFTDTSVWNLPGDDPAFVASRAGRTVGQVVQDILCMPSNANALSAAGIGAYTSLGPPTLPAATLSDLAALTVIPPWRLVVSGERILASLEAIIQGVHPNHWLHVQPDGTIRVLDTRTYSSTTLTLGGDPRLGMPILTRDYSDSYSQVEVRGNTLVKGVTLQTSPWPGSSQPDGGLQEDFAWGGHTNAAAKALWTPACWTQPLTNGTASETGSCTMPDTTHVVCAVTGTYPINYWDQSATGVLGWIVLYADSLAGQVTQHVQARVIASTASSGGHITVTLDTAMPVTAYNAYELWGLTQNCAMVGRKYLVSNAAIGAALQQFFPYPVPYVFGAAAQMVTSPQCEIIYNGNSTTDMVQLDPVNGLVYFSRPTQTIYGMPQWPDNVRVFVPVAYGTLSAWAPSSSGHAGTSFTVEGIRQTKVITCLDWKDYSNQLNMNTFASEFLDSVKDVVVEGTLPYNGLLAAHLKPGLAVSIAGIDGSTPYTTGMEALMLPNISTELRFQTGAQGTSYFTMLHLSNRRGRFAAENFLRPSITGMAFGTGGEIFGFDQADTMKFTQQAWQATQRQLGEGAVRQATTPGATEGPGALAAMLGQQGMAAGLMGQQAGLVSGIIGQQAGFAGDVMAGQMGQVGGIIGAAAQFQTQAADVSGVQELAAGMSGRGGLMGPEAAFQRLPFERLPAAQRLPTAQRPGEEFGRDFDPRPPASRRGEMPEREPQGMRGVTVPEQQREEIAAGRQADEAVARHRTETAEARRPDTRKAIDQREREAAESRRAERERRAAYESD